MDKPSISIISEEDRKLGSIEKSTFKLLFQYYGGWGTLLLVIFCKMFIN